MRTKKAIFSVLTIIFGSLGLMNIVSTDITLPIMFVFMGLTFLTKSSTLSAAATALVTCDTRDNNKRIVILAKLVNIANV